MKPYYQNDMVTLYHADARDVLPTLPRESADLIVCDPPYGVNWQSNYRNDEFDHIAGDDGSLDVVAVIGMALTRLRQHRHLYTFGRWDLAALPVSGVTELVWDKCIFGLGNLETPWGPQHEYITFAVEQSRKAKRDANAGNLSARLRRGSVLRYPRSNAGGVTRHPTEKPVPLLRELIESSSRIGETVLDWCMGSGSTGEAAMLEGRKFIGIELKEQYCEIAASRMARLPLFGGQS